MSAPSRTVCLVVAYDGAGFSGWQRLGGGARTVQKTLEDALSSLLGERVLATGSGRTDAGVHAEGQAASVAIASSRPLAEIIGRLDASLPPDLALVSAREARPGFHARYRARSKTYVYRLHDGPGRDPFAARWSFHVGSRLDEAAMARALAALPGARDFSALTNAKEDARLFVRELFEARAERLGDIVELSFTGDGFLYNQVRVMAACALEAGLGRLSPERLAAIVESRDRSAAPGALGAYGLCLRRVEYDEGDFLGPLLRPGEPPESGCSDRVRPPRPDDSGRAGRDGRSGRSGRSGVPRA